MVGRLIGQLLAFPEVAQIILTLNVPESVALPDNARVTVISNAEPKGFGANHNAAFAACTQTFFCPLNPDIEFDRNPRILNSTGIRFLSCPPRSVTIA